MGHGVHGRDGTEAAKPLSTERLERDWPGYIVGVVRRLR